MGNEKGQAVPMPALEEILRIAERMLGQSPGWAEAPGRERRPLRSVTFRCHSGGLSPNLMPGLYLSPAGGCPLRYPWPILA